MWGNHLLLEGGLRGTEEVERTAAVRFLLSVWIFIPGCDSYVTCRNDNGEPVDWYVIYKYPHMIGGGLEYLYMDGSTNFWAPSFMKINESGALANTLEPLLDFYDNPTTDFGYLLYNDQPPGCNADLAYGHSKGVVMLDTQTGVWLSHSTPRFPTYRNGNFWPNNGNRNAQTFLCVTFPYNIFGEIGEQLKYIHVFPFDHYIPTTFPNELRCIAQRNCDPPRAPWNRTATLTSIAGRSFYSFAKYSHFEDDLYSGLISRFLRKNLFVRTWGNPGQSHLLPSNCSNPDCHVYNVKEVMLPQAFLTDTVDHSKWCVTEDGPFSCIADLNRVESQKTRGGGAICTIDPAVGMAFYALVNTYEPCLSDA
ncbi:deoxyribonuclease-2-alpha-like [Acanthochromis polyacanthus]|uniref:deoxyribonuclease-2-alpha-like n=1 Tax=Acanthochromis polyacanthus TaxID=80966 RepID=UPI002234A76B|nr:deoxyribonuclease-2-alpha-like [Acanthochromis polyacanthus]